jgi:hypothetical protein
MHAVLDGEATPEEARELEELLAGDAGARAEYDALRRIFARLQALPRLEPPPGLGEAAWAHRQLSRSNGVDVSSAEPGKPPPAPERIRQVPRGLSRGSPTEETTMSQTSKKRSLWIGTGVAAAAALVVLYAVVDIPPKGDNLAGTVAPAQRYRAEQFKADDVKLGDQAVAKLMQTEAFERIVKDPKLRALAVDPGFQALARSPEALAAMARSAEAFNAYIAFASSRAATVEASRAEAMKAEAARAEAMSAQALKVEALRAEAMKVDAARAEALRAEALKVEASRAEAMRTEARRAEALRAEAMKVDAARAEALRADAVRADALSRSPEAFAALARSPEAMAALARNAEAFAVMARDPGFAALATNPAFAQALQVYAASVNAAAR